ncbi:hypothetical protein [Antrihabitans spumae]|uniref:DivIVA domain-containing protein n=1 Tax=Antrihabitans spumae TaxID=3373370 RepID=A0ABW7K9S9_9NOCA
MSVNTSESMARGRPRRAEPAEPSGYRMTQRTRREIDLARGFFGFGSTQQVIDEAVHAYLSHLRVTDARFKVAVEELAAKIAEERPRLLED